MTTRRTERLEKALERALIGGNHLPIVMYLLNAPKDWADIPSSSVALARLGSGVLYETWCAWHAIMQARDIAESTIEG